MTRRVIVLFAASLSVALALWGQALPAMGQQKSKRDKDGGSAKPAAPEKTGIAVGEKAPPIKLNDQAGKERSLDEWLHDGTVAVVFHRSASW